MATPKAQALANSFRVPGYMSFEELTALYDIAEGKELVVEVGSWCGRSSSVLAAAAKRLICIDTFQGTKGTTLAEHAFNNDIYKMFQHNMKEFTNVIVYKQRSDIACKYIQDGSADVIFIDGDHRYEGVCKDIELYSPKVKRSTGVMLFHDCVPNYPDVQRAVNEFIAKNHVMNYVHIWRSLLKIEREECW